MKSTKLVWLWAYLTLTTGVTTVHAFADGATPSAAIHGAVRAFTAMPGAQQEDADSDEPSVFSLERLAEHLPDLGPARQQAAKALDDAREAKDKAATAYWTHVIERIDGVRRPTQVRLTLEEVIQRTLANNYTIQTISFNPAVETTRVVEAESAFDAVLFGNLSKRNIDQPTASELQSTDADFLTLNAGVRKLLPHGALATAQYSMSRTKQTFAFQDPTLNPSYSTDFILDLRQPLLRGFGLDVNRSAILINKNNRQMSDLAFHRQIRDTLRQVEENYWRLVQARRDVVITARELADFENMYQSLYARRNFDVLPVALFATKADLERARADFVQRRSAMFDAEDRLLAIMNDPELTLAGGVECVPSDFPKVERIVVDRLAEVQSALDNRAELKEQELVVANAKIAVGQTANAELPRVDLAFTTTVHGLGASSDRSFDEATRRHFISYTVGVELELPIGNRGPRAAHRRAQLQRDQAIAALRDRLEGIILDVNLAVRRLDTSYDQIQPTFASIEARQRELDSTVARAETRDYGALSSELGAWRALAGTRRAILNATVDYNIAIIDLERAKGTLLDYNNVIIPTEDN